MERKTVCRTQIFAIYQKAKVKKQKANSMPKRGNRSLYKKRG